MMSSGSVQLGGNASEVGHVLGEQDASCRGSGRQDVGVGVPRQPLLADRACVDAAGPQHVRQRGRIHLVEKELQVIEAAAVSWRCESIRARISSG